MGNSFGKQSRGTALGSSFGKLSGTTLRNNCFEEQQLWEQLSGAALQLRGAAFSSNFREQLSGASLQNSFGEPFWGIGLKNRSFGAIALDSSFGEQLLVATLGRSFWEPLCRMALGSRFGEQVCRIPALGQQLWRTALGHNFLGSCAGDQLWTAFRTSFEAASGSSFGVLGTFFWMAFGSNFEEQLWGATVGSNFSALQ